MNITTQPVQTPIPTTANPSTEALRRDNVQREVIAQPSALQHSAAEKGVASERERARTPAQNNEQIDFEFLEQQAEIANSTITDSDENNGEAGQQTPSEENAAPTSQDAAGNDENNDVSDSSDGSDPTEPDFAEQQYIKELKLRDREVRAHEQAHAAAGGPYTGAPSYTFEVGPDGKKYAVEGEVSVDLSPIDGDPRATITKLQKVYNAALAPANPSIQDTRIATRAAQLIAQAQSDLLAQSLETEPSGASISPRTSVNDSFSQETDTSNDNDFDRQINATLDAQERIAPSRSRDVEKAATVISELYAGITQAYEKPPRYQFELTA